MTTTIKKGKQGNGKLAWSTRIYNDMKRAGYGEWYACEVSDRLPNKSEQREKILDFIALFHKGWKSIHLFALPGASFRLESELAEVFPGKVLISTCEFNRKFMEHPHVVRRIDRMMPGSGEPIRSKADLACATLEETAPRFFYDMVEKGETFVAKGGETSAIHVNCGADELLTRLKASEAPKLTAAWYDGMGKMDGSYFLDFLAALPDVIEDGAPVAVTLLKGREGKGFLDAYSSTKCTTRKRVLAIQKLFRKVGLTYTIKQVWVNKNNSGGGNPMINFAGVVHKVRSAK